MVPGAYYSGPSSLIFTLLEEAVATAGLASSVLGRLGADLDRVLPSPNETVIDETFEATMHRLGLNGEVRGAYVGKRVVLRMLATIASSLTQPVVRESGIMRLPQTIPGLFDRVPAPKKDEA